MFAQQFNNFNIINIIILNKFIFSSNIQEQIIKNIKTLNYIYIFILLVQRWILVIQATQEYQVIYFL